MLLFCLQSFLPFFLLILVLFIVESAPESGSDDNYVPGDDSNDDSDCSMVGELDDVFIEGVVGELQERHYYVSDVRDHSKCVVDFFTGIFTYFSFFFYQQPVKSYLIMTTFVVFMVRLRLPCLVKISIISSMAESTNLLVMAQKRFWIA